jgi:XTP/dITP diphosphohydrolase
VPHTVEEAYEVADAALAGAPAKLLDELGDLLFQVYFLALLLEEQGQGDLASVARNVHDKLVRRHPHVFADAGPRDVAQVEAGWEEIKKAEKQRRSPTEGVSRSQPAASWGAALARRAERAGLPTPPPGELSVDSPERLGERLLGVVVAAAARGWDVEDALREAVRRYAGELDAAAHARATP